MIIRSYDKMNPADRMSFMRSQLTKSHIWFGSVAMKLRMIEADWLPTAAVDDRHLFYNPTFIASLPRQHLLFVGAHEVFHVAFKHSLRMEGRNQARWNVACDYAINPLLAKAGFSILPGCLIDKQFEGMSAERIYTLLPKTVDGGGGPIDPGKSGGVVSPRNPDGTPRKQGPMERVQAERQIDGMVASAAKLAKDCGHAHGSWMDEFPKAREPEINWREVIPRFVHQNIGVPHDTTWAKPNRRFIHNNMYLPSSIHQNENELCIVIDTSGSVGKDEFAAFIGEVGSIRTVIRPSVTHLIQCDAAVQDYARLGPDDVIKADIKGRGGTSFVPPFEYLAFHKIKPDCLIYFTDMFGEFPDGAPFPVLWAATTDMKPPFGEVVRVRL